MSRYSYRLLLSLLLLTVGIATVLHSRPAFADTQLTDLEQDASQWGLYADQGQVTGTLTTTTAPTQDGNALQVSLTSGQSYAGLHAYRNLPANDTAQQLSMDVSFYYSDSTPIQALEFTMNTWVNNQRWEWAVQWEVVPASSTETAQTWRLWTGSSWQSLGVQQSLSNDAWHTLHLEGSIQSGNVQYQQFSCDNTALDVSSYQFAPVASAGDKLAVAVQLDGNAFETPYSVFLRHVNLSVS